jgi:hypothetical protein
MTASVRCFALGNSQKEVRSVGMNMPDPGKGRPKGASSATGDRPFVPQGKPALQIGIGGEGLGMGRQPGGGKGVSHRSGGLFGLAGGWLTLGASFLGGLSFSSGYTCGVRREWRPGWFYSSRLPQLSRDSVAKLASVAAGNLRLPA